jgi:hypothetical protein
VGFRILIGQRVIWRGKEMARIVGSTAGTGVEDDVPEAAS